MHRREYPQNKCLDTHFPTSIIIIHIVEDFIKRPALNAIMILNTCASRSVVFNALDLALSQ